MAVAPLDHFLPSLPLPTEEYQRASLRRALKSTGGEGHGAHALDNGISRESRISGMIPILGNSIPDEGRKNPIYPVRYVSCALLELA
jgi:hypothetical protein